jgi:hypothetical protein
MSFKRITFFTIDNNSLLYFFLIYKFLSENMVICLRLFHIAKKNTQYGNTSILNIIIINES